LGPFAIRGAIAVLAVGALLIFLLGRYSGLDLILADAVFDFSNGAFPLKHAWLTDTFNHVILKWLLMLAALGFIGSAIVDAVRPFAALGALDRLRLRIVALASVLVPLVISSLKQASSSHCPWDLARYGGDQPYVRIFEALPTGALPGHCLPAGHASSALWLLALSVYWLPDRPRTARLVAGGGIAFGAVVGFLQQLRGAHFLTHTLWSIWIACAIVLGVIVILQTIAGRTSLPQALAPSVEQLEAETSEAA
jgi:membrane-associated PAP2 superfamily phosphatase